MNQGAQRAGADRIVPVGDDADRGGDQNEMEAAASQPGADTAAEPLAFRPEVAWDGTGEPAAGGASAVEVVVAALFALLAIGWIGTVAVAVLRDPAGAGDLVRTLLLIGVAAAPVALIALVWLIVAQGGRSRERRYGRAARTLRGEAARLTDLLDTLTVRLADGRQEIEAQRAALEALGERTLAQVGEANGALARETAGLRDTAERLRHASAGAREDVAAIAQELPQADERSRRIAQELRGAGATVQDQLSELERLLAAVGEAGHGADVQVRVAADRLAAQLARIAAGGAETARGLDETAARLDRTIAVALADAERAIDATRRGVAEQAAALVALAEEGRAAVDRAGMDHSEHLVRRLADSGERIDGLFQRIAAQDQATVRMADALDGALARIEERFGNLGEVGAEQTADLAEALAALADHAEHVSRGVASGTTAAVTLFERVTAVRRVLDTNARDLEDTLPAALSRLRLHAERSLEAVSASTGEAQALARLAEDTEGKLTGFSGAIEGQQRALETLGGDADRRLAALRGQAMGLSRLIAETGENAEALAAGTADRLVEAMNRVRDSATRASDQARAAITAIVPSIAGDLAREVEHTVDRVLAERLRAHLAETAQAAREAAGQVDQAGDVLGGRIAAITRAAGNAETGMADAAERADRHLQTLVTALADAAQAMEAQVAAAAAASVRRLAGQLGSVAEAAETMETQLDRAATGSAERLAAQLATIRAAAEQVEQQLNAAGAKADDRLASSMVVIARTAQAMEEQVAAAADQAEARLAGQLSAIGRATAAVKDQLSDVRETADRAEQQNFARQVALLVESLNSASIDVAKILSSDVSDTAWAAYLRGDRGVFTRRAVRLLDAAQSRELLRRYSGEAEFREQINRYVHDFEAMLRRVLSSRDGGPLSVTLLSSDMGKLYVALAQAIERLRT
ncbi:MAG: hypothetical protein PGN09_02645 [Sphingomonas fennica]